MPGPPMGGCQESGGRKVPGQAEAREWACSPGPEPAGEGAQGKGMGTKWKQQPARELPGEASGSRALLT